MNLFCQGQITLSKQGKKNFDVIFKVAEKVKPKKKKVISGQPKQHRQDKSVRESS